MNISKEFDKTLDILISQEFTGLSPLEIMLKIMRENQKFKDDKLKMEEGK